MTRVNCAPARQHGEQRDEAEPRPRQAVNAIRQAVLNPDADDVPVFFILNAVEFNPADENGEWKF